MTFVLDASVALSWIYKRADVEEARLARDALTALKEGGAHVPTLWHTEITNSLLVGLRRNVIDLTMATEYRQMLSGLPINVDDVSVASRQDFIFVLAQEYQLSGYDATYLDLASRIGAAFATFDKRLARARDLAGIAAFS